jgi:GNAT superfamily N-acetyltransferase
MSESPTLRRMEEADLPGADVLRRLVGWNQTAEDWRHLLGLEPRGCFVAVIAEQVVGTVMTTCYGLTLAWIGMMLVHPEHRRQGIASHLMARALGYLQGKGIQCVKLDATPQGRPLYEKLGFQFESELNRWQRPAQIGNMECETRHSGTRKLREQDWVAIGEIDAAAFGVSRHDLLRGLASRSREILVWPRQGQVGGWGMLRAGSNADYIGPVACLDREGAIELVFDLLRVANDRTVFWDVPEWNEHAKEVAQEFGFEPVRPLVRMRKGGDCPATNPGALFAIADPAVG